MGKRGRKGRTWKPHEDNLLGTVPDAQLVREWGFARMTIRRHRNQLGIPSYRPPSHDR
jgi:hypothetical protein